MSIVSAETLTALFLFAAAAAWTPGPNNFMLAASGATFGFRRTLPHILGVVIGFSVMIFAVTIGLGHVFRTEPAVRSAIEWTGLAVMLYLAVRIATQSAGRGDAAAEPLSFTTAALFQWVNPKGWVMVIATAATYATGEAPRLEALVVAVVFALVGICSSTTWAAAGAALRRVLGSGWRLRAFNAAMGVLLAGSAVALVAG